MRRVKVLSFLALSTLALCFAWVGFASAYNVQTGMTVVLGKGEPIHQTVFAAGRTVNIDNEVFGDVFCGGQTVTISGTVHGDVICAAQTLQVSGKIDGDVRLAGQTVTLSAQVAGNATIAGQSFVLDAAAKIDGDASVASADASLQGTIGRDLAFAGDSGVVGSTVGRDISSIANRLTLGDGARVGGNVSVTSHNEPVKAGGAVVTGTITRTDPPREERRDVVPGLNFAWFAFYLVSTTFLGLTLVLLFPRPIKAVTENAVQKPWKALLVGFLTTVSLPFIVFVLFATLVGIPLAMFVLLVWLGIVMLTAPLSGYYVGRLILRDGQHPAVIMLAGLTILVIAFFIPILGIFAGLASFFMGTGMQVMEFMRRTPKPNFKLTEGKK